MTAKGDDQSGRYDPRYRAEDKDKDIDDEIMVYGLFLY